MAFLVSELLARARRLRELLRPPSARSRTDELCFKDHLCRMCPLRAIREVGETDERAQIDVSGGDKIPRKGGPGISQVRSLSLPFGFLVKRKH